MTKHSPEALDKFDRQLLNLLQKDCQVKAEVLGDQIGLSASAVQRRLKRLRETGAVKAEIAVIDRRAVESFVTFVAGLEIDRDNYDTVAKFRVWSERQKYIQQVYYVTGAVDLIMIVTARNVQHYDDLIAQMMADFPQVKRVNTHVVLNDLKTGLGVPIELQSVT